MRNAFSGARPKSAVKRAQIARRHAGTDDAADRHFCICASFRERGTCQRLLRRRHGARGRIGIRRGSASMPIYLAEADGLDFKLVKRF